MAGDRESILRALLAVLAHANGPIGTRAARLGLLERGFDISESSVSRRLRELDERGWTEPLGAKGRVLAPEGRQRQSEFEFTDHTAASLEQAVDVRDVHDLLDLLYARRAVECAAAADSASNATSTDIERLREAIERHSHAVGTEHMKQQPGLDLHRTIAAIAPNRMIKILSGLVLAPHLDRAEAVLDIVLDTHGNQESVLAEHQRIADAIARRDADGAEIAMREHFDAMIAAGRRLLEGDNAAVVSRLLDWMDSRSRLSTRESPSHAAAGAAGHR